MKTKIFLYLLASLIFIALAGFVLLHKVLPGKVTDRLQVEVAQRLEGETARLYQLEIFEVSFSPLFRTMHAASILLVPDTQALATLEPEALPADIFKIHAMGLEVSTGGLLALARGKDQIEFSDLQLKDLSALVIRNPEGKQQEKAGGSRQPGSLELKNFSVSFNGLKVQMLDAPDLDVFALGQGLFSGSLRLQTDEGTDGQMVDLRDPVFIAANLDILFPDGLHRFTVDSLALGPGGAGLDLLQVKVVPLFNKRQFRNQITHQTSRIEASLDTVRFRGFDLSSLVNQKYLSAEELEVSRGRIEVFRDRHPPLNTLRRPLMPVRLIRQAPIRMWLGSAQVTGLDVFYQELPQGASKEVVFPFRNLSATLTNMTNVAEQLMHDSIMRLESRARVFGSSSLTASFDYNLNDINGGYLARGTLAALPLETINPALYPFTGMRVIEGTHEQTSFYFAGNDFRTEGELTMRYTGLRLDMVPDRNRFRQTIANWAGRHFVYHPSNPGSNEETRPGIIAFERAPDRFVFHYWWNCFLTGVRSTVMRDRE